MSTLEQLIRERGALDLPDVLRVLTPAADQLAQLAKQGTFAIPPLSSVSLEGDSVHVLDGQPISPTGRAQVKHFGTLLYESLTGLPPPTSGYLELFGQRPAVTELMRRCLDDDHQAHFSRMDQVVLALRALASDTQHAVKPTADTHLRDGPPSDSSNARHGEVLGSYELIRLLGDGGMGEVYLARHTLLGREVALKLLKPEMAKAPEVVRRFFDEARVVNDIKDPHIVEVIDFVEEAPTAAGGGRVYCVMELLVGATLADVAARQGPLPVVRVAHLMRQTCQALHAAHAKGVVHRDVKPENIFVVTDRPGQTDYVKLLDFGIARLAAAANGGAAHRTQAGTVLGTPMYMSPEQAQGRTVDARTDLYAVGSVLYELIVGRPLSQELNGPQPVVLSAGGESVPPQLTALIATCIDMEPSRRPASALEIARVLHALIEVPVTPLAPVRRWWLWPGVAAVVALGIAGVALSSTSTPEPVIVAQPPPQPAMVVNAPPPTPVIEPPHAEPVAIAAPVVKPSKNKRTAPRLTEGVTLDSRVKALQRDFEALKNKYGERQLTSIERATIDEAVSDFVSARTTRLEASLPAAEGALQQAKNRLDR